MRRAHLSSNGKDMERDGDFSEDFSSSLLFAASELIFSSLFSPEIENYICVHVHFFICM